jgi:hypothetical protein
MISIGKLYVTAVKYPHRNTMPIIEKGWTHEIEEPFRRGSCLVFRVPFTYPGFAIGIWVEEQDEETALTNAMWTRVMDEVDTEDIFEWN